MEARWCRLCRTKSVSMFYSCRAFPVSGNNGRHGSPLPAPWPFSVALENRARTRGDKRAVSEENTFLARSVGRSLARVQRSAPKNSNWNFAARGKRVTCIYLSEFLDVNYTSHIDFARFSLTIVRRRHVSGARPRILLGASRSSSSETIEPTPL